MVLDVTEVPADYPVININHPHSRITAYAENVFLANADLIVNVAEREFGLARARNRAAQGDEAGSGKTRHAVVAGIPIMHSEILGVSEWRAVTYNPEHHNTFVDVETGESVLKARFTMLTCCPLTRKYSVFVPA